MQSPIPRGAVRHQLYNIPEGVAGTDATVRAMRAVASLRVGHPMVQQQAGRIVAAAREAGRRPVDALRRWLVDRVPFMPDPEGVEWLRDPVLMLGEMDAGTFTGCDCDDVAMLAATLAGACGWSSRFRTLGFDSAAPEWFSHVVADVWDGSRWRDMDVTLDQQGLTGIVPVVSKVYAGLGPQP